MINPENIRKVYKEKGLSKMYPEMYSMVSSVAKEMKGTKILTIE